ncbi:MAG: TonB-dependent receptor [Asticcacaulis sp.]
MSKPSLRTGAKGLYRFAGVSLLALMSAGSALADDAPAPAADEVTDVVVTATRRATNVQKIPYNISAIGAAEAERTGLTEISDLARVTPGLSFRDAGARDNGSVILRGLSVDPLRVSTGGDNGSVAQYINDTPVSNQPRVFDIDHIEVLRGPQGTLYGSGSLGGAIRYIVNDPKMYFDASAGAEVYKNAEAEDSSYKLTGMVNLPLIDDKLALRVALQYLDDAGFTDYPFVLTGPKKDLDYEKRTTARASLLWKPNEAFSATASVYYDNAKSGGRTGSNAGFKLKPAYDGVSDNSDPTQWSYPASNYRSYTLGKYEIGQRYEEPESNHYLLSALELKYDFGFAELTSSTSYTKETVLGHRDQTDLLLGLGFGYENYPDFRAFTTEEEDFDAVVQELRLVSKTDGPLSYVAGLYYTKEKSDGSSKEFTPGFTQYIGATRTDDLEYYSTSDAEYTEMAAFGEVTWRFNDQWQVTGGLRTFELKDDDTSCTALPLYYDPYSDAINFDCGSQSGKIKKTIYKANTSYQLNPDVMLYGTFSQGFRRGGVNILPSGGQFVGITDSQRKYLPDTVDNFELGVRSQWFDKAVTLNAALYHIDWQDVQLASLAPGNLPIVANAGKATSDGVEIEAKWRATDALSLSFGYAYTKAEIAEDYVNVDENGNVLNTFLKGTALPGTAESQASLGVDYVFPTLPVGELSLHADASYSSKVTTSAELDSLDYRTLDGVTELNASAMLVPPMDGVKIRLYVSNLTNEYAFVASQGPSTYGLQGSFLIPIKPRTIGVSITKNF